MSFFLGGVWATRGPWSAKSDQFWVDIFKPKWNLSYIAGAGLQDSEEDACVFCKCSNRLEQDHRRTRLRPARATHTRACKQAKQKQNNPKINIAPVPPGSAVCALSQRQSTILTRPAAPDTRSPIISALGIAQTRT